MTWHGRPARKPVSEVAGETGETPVPLAPKGHTL